MQNKAFFSFEGIGNNICDSAYDNPECEWDEGDCLEFKNELYPGCEAYQPSFIGNEHCEDTWSYNNEKCGWPIPTQPDAPIPSTPPSTDAPTTVKPATESPTFTLTDAPATKAPTVPAPTQAPTSNLPTESLCDVPRKKWLGDGICDGGEYNTAECGYDGGDCDEFNEEYPECDVPDPWRVGDGNCDDDLNAPERIYDVEECGFDNDAI